MEVRRQWTETDLRLRYESPENFIYCNALAIIIPHSPCAGGAFCDGREGDCADGG